MKKSIVLILALLMLVMPASQVLAVSDFEPPITTINLNGNLGSNGIYYGDLQVELSAQDYVSGVSKTQYSLNGGQTWSNYTIPITFTESKVYSLSYRSIDNNNNVESTKLKKFTLKPDLSSPATSIQVQGNMGQNSFYIGAVNIILTAVDNQSGVDYTEYSVDGGETWNRYIAPVLIEDPQKNVISYRSIDKAGNTEKIKKTKINLDSIPPSSPHILFDPSDWTNTSVNVSLIHGIDEESGIRKTQYRLSETDVWTNYESSFTVNNPEQVVYARSIDFAGNSSEITMDTVAIDKTPPTSPEIKLSYDDWSDEEIVFNVTGGMDEESKIRRLEFKIGEQGTWQEYMGVEVIEDEGQYDIYARAIDWAGNIGGEAESVVKIDKSPPTKPTITLNHTSWTNEDVIVQIVDGIDTLSGVMGNEYKIGEDGVWTEYLGDLTFSEVGTSTIYARSVDNVGIISEEASAVIKIDRTPPSPPKIQTKRGNLPWNKINDFVWTHDSAEVLITKGTDDSSDVITQYRIGESGEWITYLKEFTLKFSAGADIYARSVDSAGNASNLDVNKIGVLYLRGTTCCGFSVEGRDGSSIQIVSGHISHRFVKFNSYYWSGENTILTYTVRYVDTNSLIQYEGMVDTADERLQLKSDTQPPSAPSDLKLTLKTNTSISFSWLPSTDDVSLSGYNIYKSGKLIGSTNSTTYSVTGLSMNTLYNFTVKSKDTSENLSLPSNSLSVKTNEDFESPSAPHSLAVVKKANGTYELTWKASLDNVAVVQYEIYSGANVIGASTKTSYTLTSLIPNTEYNVYIKAKDADDNVSIASDSLIFTTGTDLNPPNAPGNLKVDSWSRTSVSLIWTNSTMDEEIVGYNIYQNGNLIDSTNATEYLVEGLNPKNAYKYTVKSTDAAGNESVESNAVTHSYFRNITTLSSSYETTAYVKPDGTVWMWGENGSGLSADGTKTIKTTAIQIPGLSDVVSIAVGRRHIIALKVDGTIWTWGDNSYGQLGREQTIDKIVPERIDGLANIVGISGYDNSSYALKEDGTIWAWGSNSYGQLGIGNYGHQFSPVQITALNGVTEISAGNDFAIALRDDMTVWSWGSNYDGRLGDGTTTNRSLPVQTSLNDVVSISAGGNHSAYIKVDGSLWSVGNNGFVSNQTAAQVSGIENVVLVRVNYGKTYALTSDGEFWAWGLNNYGDIGDGSLNASNVPKIIPSLFNSKDVATGTAHGAAFKTDGTVWAWGKNYNGQLGDGTLIQRLTPVQMKENTAPIISLSYPLGTKDNPTETTIGTPKITWSQVDSAVNTIFKEYQVQVLNLSGEIIADSNIVSMDSSSESGSWIPNVGLPSNELLQVRVRVKDETLWSEWSEVKWLVASYTIPIVKADSTSNKITLGWGAIGGATEYEVEVDGVIISNGLSTTYVHHNLLPNTGYFFRVRSKNNENVSAWSTSLYKKTAPIKTNILNVIPSSTSLVINWSQVSGAVSYDLEINESIVEVSSTNYTKYNLISNTSYTIRVRAKNNLGELGEWSTLVVTKTQLFTPSITVVSTKDLIELNWSPIANAMEYEVEVDGEIISTGTNTKYTHTDLLPSTPHTYKVRAKSVDNVSAWSTIFTKYTAPTSIDVVNVVSTSTTISITWPAVTGATGYEVEVNGYVSKTTTNSYGLGGQKANTSYTIRIRANNTSEYGEWSIPLLSRTQLVTPVISAVAKSTEITLNWAAVEGATEYEVEVDGTVLSNGSNTNFVHTDLIPSTSHIYKVRAKSTNNSSAWSTTTTKYTTPATSESINIIPTSTSLAISWAAINGATGYDLEINGALTSVTTTSYTKPSLPANTNYSIRMRAKNAGGTGDWSALVVTKTQLVTPVITATSTENQITLNWNSIAGATNYEVQLDGVIVSNVMDIKYVHESLSPSTSHTYKVRAISADNISAWSTTVTKYTTPTKTEQITILPTSTTLAINWQAVSGATGYELEINGAIVSVSTTSYTKVSLLANTNYSIRLRAKNTGGVGEWSSMVVSKTLLSTPTVTTVSLDSQITLTWGSILGATGYELEVDGTIISNILNTNYTHTGLLPSTSHTYKVRSISTDNVSAWSTIVTKYTTPTTTGTVSVVPTSTSLVVNWPAVNGATGYDVEINGTAVANSSTSYTKSSLLANTSYTIRVRAKNTGGVGEWSAPVMTKTLLLTPTITAVSTSTQVTLNWGSIVGASLYEVEADGIIVASDIVNTTYMHENLTPSTSHTYKVRAKSVDNSSAWSTIVTKYTTPATIETVNVAPTSTSLVVTWPAVIGATGYDVEINGTAVTNSSTSYTKSSLPANTSYTVRVRAKNTGGVGEWSAPVMKKTLLLTPTVTAVSASTQVTLNWGSIVGALLYEVEADGIIVASDIANTTYMHENLTPSTSHTYKVRAKSVDNSSAWSTIVTKYTTPATIETVNVAPTSASLVVTWPAVIGATGYDVEINGTAVTNSSTSYTKSGLSANTSYTVRVRAKNTGGVGEWSAPVMTKTLLLTPTATATSTNNQITVNWGSIVGATEYEIEVDGIVINVGANTTYVHTGLAPKTSHIYRVRAWNTGNLSVWSFIVNKATLA